MKPKLYAQYDRINQHYSLNRYNSENGFPQNTITGIVQDNQGYIWLASQGGLVKWDGAEFTRIPQTPGTKNSLTRILDLITLQSKDSIYCITNSFQISLITKGKIQDVRISRKAGETEADASKRFWLLKDKRLRFDKNPAEAYVILNLNDTNYINYINQNQIHSTILTNNLLFSPIKIQDTLYFQDTFFQWYYVFRKVRKKATIILTGDILKNPEHKTAITTVVGSQNVHIVKCGNSFYSVKKSGQYFYTYFLFNYYIPGITSSYYDSSSRQLLFGTNASGLYVIKKNQFLSALDSSSNRPSHHYTSQLYGQLLLNQNIILSNFRFAYNLKTKKVFLHPFSFKKSIHQLSDSTILCETDNKNQLKQFTKDLKLIKTYKGLEVTKKDNYVTSIVELPEGKLILGTIEGIFSVNNNDSLIKEQSIDQSQISTFGVECLKMLNDSILWIGSRNGIFEHHLYKKTTVLLKATASLTIRQLKNDIKAKTIWISTYGQGLYCYRNQQFTALPLDKKGYLSQAHFFAEDNKGRFWIPTNNGLFEVSKQKLIDFADNKISTVYYYHWTNQDGFITNEFNGGSNLPYIKTPDNLFTFPSINGLVIFNPDSIKHITTKYPVSITDIIVDDISIENTDNTLSVKSSVKNIKLALSVAYYGNRNNLTLKYRISSHTNNWLDVPHDYKIIIPQIYPGQYTLQLKIITGLNDTEEISNFFNLTVLPQWYETIIFRIISATCLIYFLFWLFKKRVQKTEKKNQELKLLIEQKTIELSQTIRHLEKSLEENELMLLALSHDLLGPLNFSLLASQDILSQWEELPDKRKKQMTNVLSNALRKMSLFVSDFLTWISFDSKNEVALVSFNALDFLKSIASRYASHNNTIEFDCKEDLMIKTNKRILEIIVGNIFHNAAKFTKNGTIRLSIYKEDTLIVINCKDTGQGMTKDQITNILTTASTEGADYRKSFKLGYRIIRFFLPKIKARIDINSEKGYGTEVMIYIETEN